MQATSIADWSLLQREMYMTPQDVALDEASAAVKQSFFGIFCWGLAMTCIKTSVALTLLRLPPSSRFWRPFLWAVLAVQTTYFIGDTLYIFLKCRPLQGAWDLTVPGRECTSPETDVVVSSIGSTINIATDVSLSLAPMFMLWKLRRPRRERILVCGLTCMGLFASGSSVAKAVMVGQWPWATDPWALAVSIATWTIVEQFVAVLAACSPSLKGPIQRVLGKFGILLTEYGSRISFVGVSPTGRVAAVEPGSGGGAVRYEVPLDEEEGGMLEVGRSAPATFEEGRGEVGEKTEEDELGSGGSSRRVGAGRIPPAAGSSGDGGIIKETS